MPYGVWTVRSSAGFEPLQRGVRRCMPGSRGLLCKQHDTWMQLDGMLQRGL